MRETDNNSGIVTTTNPGRDCSLCPRLVEFRHIQRLAHPEWHNAPVDSWVTPTGDDDVELLIAGLAPGLHGANRTGRPFTGDYAGDLLYATLSKYNFASGTYAKSPDDGLLLHKCAITNAVRCVPPQNKPVGNEINSCKAFLGKTLQRFNNLKVVVTLGKIAHDSTIRTLGAKPSQHPFAHAAQHRVGEFILISSYHCSRYNTNTGRLTTAMFEEIFQLACCLIDHASREPLK